MWKSLVCKNDTKVSLEAGINYLSNENSLSRSWICIYGNWKQRKTSNYQHFDGFNDGNRCSHLRNQTRVVILNCSCDWYYDALIHRREYCNADDCDCLKISPWLTIPSFSIFFLLCYSMVEWGLHLTSTIMSSFAYYAACSHNYWRKKAHSGIFKHKSLISTKQNKKKRDHILLMMFLNPSWRKSEVSNEED